MNQDTEERVSYRSPDQVNIHVTPKVEAIYNALTEYKKLLKEPESYKDIYTPDILMRILEKKAGKEINKDIFLELFQKVKKNIKSEFNIYDWIQVYIEAEDVLTARIERLKLKINDVTLEESQLQSWLEAERSNLAQTNPLSNQKSIWVNILDGELVIDNRRISFENPPCVVISYGEKYLQSKFVEASQHPRWNQAFKIPYVMSEPYLILSVQDTQGKNYGSIKLNTSPFTDQKKRKEWIYLSSGKGDSFSAKLNVSIILLNTELEKIQNEINEKEIQMNECHHDIAEYQMMLDELYLPFKSLNFGDFRASVLNQSNRPSVFSPDGQITKQEKILVDRLTAYTNKYISNWARFFFLLSIVLCLLSFVINYVRPTFIELAVIMYIYCESMRETLSHFSMRAGMSLGFLSLLSDLFWLFTNTRDWCQSKPGYLTLPGCELINFVVTLTFLYMILKVVWIIALWRNSALFDEYQEKSKLFLKKDRATANLSIRDGMGSHV